MKKFQVEANGTCFGTYYAETAQQACDMCAQDAGYLDEADMENRIECESELQAFEIA